MAILELNQVNKSFGSVEVIKDLSFTVEEHAVFGFLGKNGAGKTTTMKLILGFLQPDCGEIKVCNENVTYGNAKTNRYIGYLPDVPEFYGYMTPKEYLKLCGEITGLKGSVLHSRIKEMLCLVGLEESNRRIRGFSRGMKQRLGIAQALLNEPKLLICDEPTSALDPVGRKEILDILAVAKQRTTIVFSTHILSDVERICDSVGILNQGKLVLQGKVSDIRNKYRKDMIQIEVAKDYPTEVIITKLKEIPYVLGVNLCDTYIEIQLSGGEVRPGQILALLSEQQIPLLRYEQMEPSLENVFLEVVQ
jgi:ABC-2 type transport system ATP-binding protein